MHIETIPIITIVRIVDFFRAMPGRLNPPPEIVGRLIDECQILRGGINHSSITDILVNQCHSPVSIVDFPDL